MPYCIRVSCHFLDFLLLNEVCFDQRVHFIEAVLISKYNIMKIVYNNNCSNNNNNNYNNYNGNQNNN